MKNHDELDQRAGWALACALFGVAVIIAYIGTSFMMANRSIYPITCIIIEFVTGIFCFAGLIFSALAALWPPNPPSDSSPSDVATDDILTT